MAAELMELLDVNVHDDDQPFDPYAYYGEEEDSLTVYFSGEADYAKWMNHDLTVFRSLDTDEIVGFQITSVRGFIRK